MGWHAEVRRVWEELKASDAKTPYKRAVAEAHARRSGKVAAAPAVVEEKKGGKKAAAKTEEVKAASAQAQTKTEAKAEKKGKKSSA